LKENVIMGKLIPAGTGAKHYRSVLIANDDDTSAESNGHDLHLTTAIYAHATDEEE
jgi:hypothetical protein